MSMPIRSSTSSPTLETFEPPVEPPKPKEHAETSANHHQSHGLAEQIEHVSHGTHLVLEGAEDAAHFLHGAVKLGESVDNARKVMTAQAALGQQLGVMARTIEILERASATMPRALDGLDDVKAAYTAARSAYEADSALRSAAVSVIVAGKDMGNIPAIGKAAAKLEHAMNASPIGQKILSGAKIMTDPRLVKAMGVLNALSVAYNAYGASNAQTTAGKILSSGLAGAGAVLLSETRLLSIVDFLAPAEYKPSAFLRGTADALAVVAESGVTGDVEGLLGWQAAAKAGKYTPATKAAVELGDEWARRGIAKTLVLAAREHREIVGDDFSSIDR